jgi:polysaccharide chain length determinant protein (PEP-CTERM system associated)
MLGHRPLEAADYLAILKRRRGLILFCLVFYPILAAVATRFIPPKYMSQTLVLIEHQKVPDEFVKPVVESNLDSRLASMKEQILSRSRVQPIIERYNLNAGNHATMDDRIEQTRKAIEIKPIRSAIANTGGLPGFFISFTTSDAHTAQLVCGEITTLFLNENLRSREATAEGTTDFLKGQLEDAKRSLDEQDAKLAAFQRQYNGKLPQEEGSNMGMMNSLNTQLEAATQALAQQEQNKIYQQSLLAQMEQSTKPTYVTPAGTTAPAPMPLSGEALAKQKELDTLKSHEAELAAHYTPNYPDVIAIRRQIADLRREIAALGSGASGQSGIDSPNASSAAAQYARSMPDSVQVQQLRAQLHAADQGIAEKRREQAMIQGRLGMYQDRLSSSPQVEEEYKALTRDYNTAQKFYDELLQKMSHSKMATDLERRQEGEQFRVMDEPNLPDAPSFPKVSYFAIGGLFFGLFMGCGLAAVKEFKDTSLRTERDVLAFTGLPTLGVISVAGSLVAEIAARNTPRARLKAFFRRRPAPKPDANKLADVRG